MERGRGLKPRSGRLVRARELKQLFGLGRVETEGVSIAQQVENGLGLLGVEVAAGTDSASILVRKKRRKAEQWWDDLPINGVPGAHVHEITPSQPWDRCIGCGSMSALREVLTRVKEARLAAGLRRGHEDKVGKLSAWGMASAVVLQCAVNRVIFVRGEYREDVNWCCEWMMGDLDEEFPAHSFVVDLPVKLLKGCAVRVWGNGAFAVRVDATKALKLIKVGGGTSKDADVTVLRAGAGRAGYARRSRRRRYYTRYCRWRPFVAVVAVPRRAHLGNGSAGYGATANVVYLD